MYFMPELDAHPHDSLQSKAFTVAVALFIDLPCQRCLALCMLVSQLFMQFVAAAEQAELYTNTLVHNHTSAVTCHAACFEQ